MIPPEGSICGRLTRDLPPGCLQGGGRGVPGRPPVEGAPAWLPRKAGFPGQREREGGEFRMCVCVREGESEKERGRGAQSECVYV